LAKAAKQILKHHCTLQSKNNKRTAISGQNGKLIEEDYLKCKIFLILNINAMILRLNPEVFPFELD